MQKATALNLLLVLSLILGIIGFRLVTQAGLQGDAGLIQNDGYAVSGGFIIVVAGVCIGIWVSEKYIKSGKR